jgi:WD40 repeat protein
MSLSASGDMRLWDLARGEARWTLDSDRVCRAAFTPDGQHLLIDCYKTEIGLWEVASGERLAAPVEYPQDWPFFRYYFSPDGTLFLAVTAGDRRYGVCWWAYPSWEPLGVQNAVPVWPGVPEDLAFRPDGRLFAVLCGDGVCLLEAPGGARRSQLPFRLTQEKSRLAFAPDGRHLAVHSGPRAVVFDVESGRQVAEPRLAKKFIKQAVFMPDGRYLATVSNEATVKFWDTSSWKLAHEFAWQVGGLRCLAFAPDGLTAAAGGTGRKIVVWDVDL